MVKILIDDRDIIVRRYDIELENMGYEVTVQRQETDIEIPELSIGIERKSYHDFTSSVYNNAIFSQAKILQETYLRPYLLIEGDPAHLDPKFYFGVINSLETGIGIRVREVYNCLPLFIDSLIRKSSSQHRHISPFRKPHKPKNISPQEQINFTLQTLPGIGAVKLQQVRGKKLIPAIRALKDKMKAEFREMVE